MKFFLFIFLILSFVICLLSFKSYKYISNDIISNEKELVKNQSKFRPINKITDDIIPSLQVQGLVMLDGKPIKAEIEVTSIVKDGKFKTNISSNKLTGSFLLNLPVNDQYELVLKIDKFPQQVIELNTLGIDSFVVINVYADFTSAEYDKKISELSISTTKNNKISFDKFDKKAFGANYGQKRVDDLVYKVQIAAYKLYENFNYNSVIGMPKIIRQTDKDYITRFSMGNFDTFNEAQKLLEKVQSNNLKDAFIYAVYKGEKKFLNQLLQEKIVL